MSYSKRETKLKKREEKQKISPLRPLSCRLSHRQTSTLQGLHIAVTSWQGQGFITQATAYAFPLTNPHHSPSLLDIQTSFPYLFCSLPTERLPAHSPT